MIVGIASADHLRADRSPDGIEKWGGAGWARLGQYVPHFQEAGLNPVVGILWQQDDGLYIENDKGTKVRPDIVIIQRLMHATVDEASRFGQSKGQVVINDVDDWYWGLDPRNAAFKASHPKLNTQENTTYYAKAIAASSFITTSTPYLAQRLQKRVNCPIVLLPNYIDVSRFTPVTQSAEPTIGWAGSTEHRSGDLEVLRGVLGPVARDHGYKVHHGGAYLDGALQFHDLVGMEEDEVTTAPRCLAEDYPGLLTFDVGIVPLRESPFNHAKSAIKGLEYAASGIPFVASDSDSYVKLWEKWDREGFFIAQRPNEWRRHLARLRDLNLRLEIQATLLDRVQEFDIAYGAERWINLLEGA